jgi:hypothetical protein
LAIISSQKKHQSMTSVSQGEPSFFSFPHPINASVARAVAGGVVLMAAATIVFDQPWITLLLAYGFIARVAAGPRLSPLAYIVTTIIVPKFNLPYRPVAGPPKRFAASIGIVFSVTAAVLALGFGLNGAAYIVLGGLICAFGTSCCRGVVTDWSHVVERGTGSGDRKIYSVLVPT